MEDNKPFMPPPPKQLQKKSVEPVLQQTLPPKPQEETKIVEPVQVEEKLSKKKNFAWKTVLYWTGFALSIVLFGILIFFLAK